MVTETGLQSGHRSFFLNPSTNQSFPLLFEERTQFAIERARRQSARHESQTAEAPREDQPEGLSGRVGGCARPWGARNRDKRLALRFCDDRAFAQARFVPQCATVSNHNFVITGALWTNDMILCRKTVVRKRLMKWPN